MPTTAKEALRILQKAGFAVIRQKGSHVQLKHPDGRRTTVPMYAGDLKPGTKHAIEKATGIELP